MPDRVTKEERIARLKRMANVKQQQIAWGFEVAARTDDNLAKAGR